MKQKEKANLYMPLSAEGGYTYPPSGADLAFPWGGGRVKIWQKNTLL